MAVWGGQAYKVSMESIRAALIFAVLAALCGCTSGDSPEERIREVIGLMESAAEARDVGDLLEHVSADYRDEHGRTREELSRYVRGYFVANQSIHLLSRVEEIEFPSSDEARAKVVVGMLGRQAEAAGAWDLAADLYEFDVALVLERGDWRIAYAQWMRP